MVREGELVFPPSLIFLISGIFYMVATMGYFLEIVNAYLSARTGYFLQ